MNRNYKGITIKSDCPSCKKETNHKIVEIIKEKHSDEDSWFQNEYMIIMCQGCNTYSFRKEYVDENCFYGNEEVTLNPDIEIYPKPEILKSNPIYNNVPRNVRSIYNEAIIAVNNDCNILAAAGFRAVVEAICANKKISSSDLNLDINNLCRSGIINKKDRDRLHSIRFLGNESIHAKNKPKLNDLLFVNKIIENILNNIYVLDADLDNTLTSVIDSYEEFENYLNTCISSKEINSIHNLNSILGNNRRLIKEDIPDFEKQLNIKIETGEYNKLSLHSSSDNKSSSNQKYKIEFNQ